MDKKMDNTETNRKERCAIYVRVSTKKDTQMESIEDQKKRLLEVIDRMGWEYSGKEYRDTGITGTSTEKRKAFNQMVEDAPKGDFSIVVVREASRFARNLRDFINSIYSLKEYGVRVYFADNNMFSDDRKGSSYLVLLSDLAEQESENKRNYTLQAHLFRRERRMLFGSDNRFGYKLVKTAVGKSNVLEIIPEEAEVIKRIFDEYVNHKHGIRTIVSILNSENLKTRSKGQWGTSAVREILYNKVYCGYLRYGLSEKKDLKSHRERKKNSEYLYYKVDETQIPPIIDEETYEKAQKILCNNSIRANEGMKKRGKKTKTCSYSKVMRCECGSVFHRRYIQKQNYKGEGRRYISFELASYNREAGILTDGESCPIKPINALRLDMMARMIFEELLSGANKTIKEVYNRYIAVNEREDIIKEIQKKKRVIKGLEDKIDNKEEYFSNEYTRLTEKQKEKFRIEINKYTEDLKNANYELEELQEKMDYTPKPYEETIVDIEETIKNKLTEENRCGWEQISNYAIEKYVKRIVVHHDLSYSWYISLNDYGKYSSDKKYELIAEKTITKVEASDMLKNIYGRKFGYRRNQWQQDMVFRVYLV